MLRTTGVPMAPGSSCRPERGSGPWLATAPVPAVKYTGDWHLLFSQRGKLMFCGIAKARSRTACTRHDTRGGREHP